MEEQDKTYKLPTDSQPAMVGETAVAYAEQSSQGHIILTIPQGVDAEPLREKVKTYYDALLKDVLQEQLFRNTLEKWLEHTGVYSGPNLCWDNEPFRQIQSMGAGVITMIDRASRNLPEYTHRHLGWLKSKLLEV